MSKPNQPDLQVLSPAVLRDWPLPDSGGKQARGTVLVIGGSRRSPGAVLLAGNAALRAGAGRLQMAGPESVATALAIHVPESTVVALPETSDGDVSSEAAGLLDEWLDVADSVLIGPGLQDAGESRSLVADVLKRVGPDTIVTLDGYGLRDLTPEVTAPVTGRLLLTPTVAEGEALLGREPHALGELLEAAATVAERFQAVVALHGKIADPDSGRWVNETGPVGLGTPGSGDVLAGLIAGLSARAASPAQAACWGTYVHTAAGERLAARIARVGFLARELIDEAPLVLAELQA